MKKVLVLLLALSGASLCGAQTPTGWWLGILEEASLPLNLHIYEKDGRMEATCYSPMQSLEPMKASSVEFSGDTLHYASKALQLKMTFTYNRDRDGWHCRFSQGFLSSSLDMVRTDTLFTPRRPQYEAMTARKAKYYDDQEVVVSRKRAGVTLTGTLSMPVDIDPMFSRKGPQPKPAVVLVSGSGQQNRDEELMGHRPFAILADYLASRGIAVLRYDDRGTGGSKGDVANATTKDFADDAEAMMEWLRRQPGIDPKRVGIIGHSEGGMIAPMVAARNRHAKFVVMLAGPGCSGAEVLVQQNEALFRSQGIEEKLIALKTKYMSALFAGDTNIDQMLQGYGREELKQVGLNKGAVLMLKQQLEMPWMKTFVGLDPAIYLGRVRCPILAINGERDLQVLSEPNLKRIKELAPQADLLSMPELNHLMQHCTTGSPQEYMMIEETFSEEVMEHIWRWIHAH